MTLSKSDLTIGVEEEYLLVDLESRDLVNDPPPDLMKQCAKLSKGQVSAELMRSQIEVGTKVCHTVEEARQDLSQLRRIIVDVCGGYGYAPIAVSTHPFAKWQDQKQTAKERYASLTHEMQAAARRLLICGMHTHVGLGDQELRIDLMNQLSYFLPHLLALSCSSPFWEGEDMGLKSYRLTVFDALPRTGLPEQFDSHAEYQRHVDVLTKAGLVEDASTIWWDLRPSARFPTLETRIMDVCTHLDDAISLVALNLCLLRMLYRLRLNNQRWRVYAHMLIDENRWRAMRYSYDEGLIDLAKGQVVEYAQLLEELIELVEEDAVEFGCVREIEHLREILTRGTSAHQQLQVYHQSLGKGRSEEEALKDVVDWLIKATVPD